MNENYEKYIKDLPEELQEKARQCKTLEELNEFVADNDLEIPGEVLEMVSGGKCGGNSKKAYCIYCGEQARLLQSPVCGDNTHWCEKCVRPLNAKIGEIEWR